jgi:hypothetical protein
VNLAKEVPDLYPNLFDYKQVSGTEDDQFSFLKHFDAVIQFVNKSRKSGSVLIHGRMDCKIAALVGMAYLIKTDFLKP